MAETVVVHPMAETMGGVDEGDHTPAHTPTKIISKDEIEKIEITLDHSHISAVSVDTTDAGNSLTILNIFTANKKEAEVYVAYEDQDSNFEERLMFKDEV
uniref:Uncharacterized protein n=1 Tax=Glossina brevipalpis TaxID=37001 RepID=A0A1A9W5F2_9MUSC